MSQFYYVAQVVRSAALAAAVAAVALHRIGVGARPLLGAGLRLGLAVAVSRDYLPSCSWCPCTANRSRRCRDQP